MQLKVGRFAKEKLVGHKQDWSDLRIQDFVSVIGEHWMLS